LQAVLGRTLGDWTVFELQRYLPGGGHFIDIAPLIPVALDIMEA
jgi:hypothetical protein